MTEGPSRSNARLWPWLLFSAIWIAGVATVALRSWPTLPLDLPAGDPQVQAALARAVRNHMTVYALAGLVPAALVLALAWLGRRRRLPR